MSFSNREIKSLAKFLLGPKLQAIYKNSEKTKTDYTTVFDFGEAIQETDATKKSELYKKCIEGLMSSNGFTRAPTFTLGHTEIVGSIQDIINAMDNPSQGNAKVQDILSDVMLARRFLEETGFLETETGFLETVTGGKEDAATQAKLKTALHKEVMRKIETDMSKMETELSTSINSGNRTASVNKNKPKPASSENVKDIEYGRLCLIVRENSLDATVDKDIYTALINVKNKVMYKLSTPGFLEYYRNQKNYPKPNLVERRMMLEYARLSDISYPNFKPWTSELLPKEQTEMLFKLLGEPAIIPEDLQNIMEDCLTGQDRIKNTPGGKRPRESRDLLMQEKLVSALLEKALDKPPLLVPLMSACSKLGKERQKEVESALKDKSLGNTERLAELTDAYIAVMDSYRQIVVDALVPPIQGGVEVPPIQGGVELSSTLEQNFSMIKDATSDRERFRAAKKAFRPGQDGCDYAGEISIVLKNDGDASSCFEKMVVANFRLQEVLRSCVQQGSAMIASNSIHSASDIVLKSAWDEVKSSCGASGQSRREALGFILQTVTGLSIDDYNNVLKVGNRSADCFKASTRPPKDILRDLNVFSKELKKPGAKQDKQGVIDVYKQCVGHIDNKNASGNQSNNQGGVRP